MSTKKKAYQIILVGAEWTASFFLGQVDSFICNVRNEITIILPEWKETGGRKQPVVTKGVQ